MFRQMLAVTTINLKSLPQRLWLSLATVVAVGLVVTVLLAFLAMANGFKRTIADSGADDVAVVLRSGSLSEINSVVLRDQVRLIEDGPGIARGADGKPQTSGELYLTVDGIKRSTGTKASLPLRGLGPQGPALRRDIVITAGRMFNPGSNEIIVGKALGKEFDGFDLGQTVTFNSNQLDRGRHLRRRRQRVRVGDLGRSAGGAEPVQTQRRRPDRAGAVDQPGGDRGAARLQR